MDLYTESINEWSAQSWEHVLYTSDTRKFGRARYGRQQLRLVEIPLDKVPNGVNWVGVDFGTLPIASLYAMRLDTGFDFLQGFLPYQLREAHRLSDGVEGVFAAAGGTRILVVKFGHVPEWAPIRVRQYISKTYKLDRNDKFVDQLDKFLPVSDTVTEWELSSKGEYVPAICRMIISGPRPEECEVRLNEWKFGVDVIDADFESDSFTVESLKEFQFDQIRKKLIESRAADKKDD